VSGPMGSREDAIAASLAIWDGGDYLTRPAQIFKEELGTPVIWIPNSYAGCHQHGPDEHGLGSLLHEALGLMAGLWWDIGAGRMPVQP